jgi:hypothetical protein
MQGCDYSSMFSVAPDGPSGQSPTDPGANIDSTMNDVAAPGDPTVPVDSSSGPGFPSATVIAPVVPVEPVASPVIGSLDTIVSVNGTWGGLAALAGAGIGSLAGPAGAAFGSAVGSMIGIGPSLTWVPSTDSVYFGGVVAVTPVPGGGTGGSLSVVLVPDGQDPNAIAQGYSTSLGTQFNPWTGWTTVTSPGNGMAQGPQWGTRSPVTISAGYNICLWNCQP